MLFKEFLLNLTIECNKASVDYLDITLNLLDGTYNPYQKPENFYIRKPSNHPPNIEQILSGIETNISNYSSDETVHLHVADYEKTLKNSEYNIKLQFKPIQYNTNNKINR